ncbi:6742_t:CDS:2 [Paraglomus brasilianum]|uniref:6742_t:CDS:1 n=1 Tax=Paraglomus brasilianum TaxID=144538 RepID=A0A9N8Z106_9GLOM|nr:6742_t:CDS:2 [Paraglomus brasilianum]
MSQTPLPQNQMTTEEFKESQKHQPSKKEPEKGKESYGPSSTALGGVGAYAGHIPVDAVKHEPTTGDKVQGAVNKAVGTAKEYVGSAVKNENLKKSGTLQKSAGDKQMHGIDTS